MPSLTPHEMWQHPGQCNAAWKLPGQQCLGEYQVMQHEAWL